jgi:hypothetical protein
MARDAKQPRDPRGSPQGCSILSAPGSAGARLESGRRGSDAEGRLPSRDPLMNLCGRPSYLPLASAAAVIQGQGISSSR